MPNTEFSKTIGLPIGILDTLPNPVLVKDAETRYVWVNEAFETLFSVKRNDLIGRLDSEVFKDRQVAQCNGGDLRVLASGAVDEATETVFKATAEPVITITRKSRLVLEDGRHFLVGVMHDITRVTKLNEKLEAQSQELKTLANTDPLTGVLNRRSLNDTAGAQFSAHQNTGGVMICDIDFFKKINDTHGHDIGDAALVHFARILGRAIREGDPVARFGGEEFVVLLPGAGLEETKEVAERIRAMIEATPLIVAGKTVKMTVSIGVVMKTGANEFDLDALLPEADANLYRAKEEGRNRVVMVN